jgi:pimeloyl-ACP methyl ester carboxylesterase
MTMVVFVHGVPETAAIWRKVQGLVGRESVALSLPGFGCPRPSGFGATKDEYVAWLVGELDAIGEPVDLVGHDWGAALTQRVALAHADRLRSWVADCGSLAHPDYVWHAFAQLWQTPGEGEQSMRDQEAQPPEARAAGLAAIFALPEEDALELASGQDRTMDDCILDLYRSAVPNPHASWGPMRPSPAPGLVVHPSEDLFSIEPLAREVAGAFGAGFEVLDGANHFWPYQTPEAAAALLQAFWATVG